MKRIFYISILIGCLLSSYTNYGQFKLMGAYDTSCCALPYYLTTPDTLTTCLLTRMHSSLPEGVSVLSCAPQYLYNSAPTVLHLTDSGDVWLTYAGEGNWYESVLGFYTFPWGTPPTPATFSDTMVTIVFPNATLEGYGGMLHIGDRVYLGHFPANTGFGFMLIANGWRYLPHLTWRSDSFLADNKDIYYSDPHLNPNAVHDTNRHVVGLYDALSNLIVMGFEDQNRGGLWQPDNDFNDVLFYLKTSNPNGFDTIGLPQTLITCDSGVSSGGGSGLESQNLGGKVSKRDFENIKNGIINNQKPDYKKMIVFNPNLLASERTTVTSVVLERFMPSTLFVPKTDFLPSSDSIATTPYYSSPADLTTLTTAKDVLSVDYVKDNQAKAAVLAITTVKKAYNHTKSICDRFRGATLMATDTIRIQGYRFVLFAMKQPDGTTEYSITFDIGKSITGDTFKLQSKWLITEYQGYDSVFNFQVWASNPGYTIKLTNQILTKMQAIYPLIQVDQNFSLPQTYIANGKRNKGNLNIVVNNLTNSTNAYIMFEENKTETLPVDTIYYRLPLSPNASNTFAIPILDGYQYEGYLYIDSILTDVVYMADGNWSLDYDHTTTTMNSYVPGNETSRVYLDSEYPIYRSVAIKAGISDYLYAYKFLTSGDEKVDLTAYHSFKFHGVGDGQITIRLIKTGIANYSNQYHTNVTLVPSGQDYVISFDDFYSDSTSAGFNPKDVSAVVFDFNFYKVQSTMNFFAGNISFSPQEVISTRLAQSKTLNISPNPNEGNFTCSFYSDVNKTLELAVSDAIGRIFYRQTIQAVAGKNTVQVSMPYDIPKPSLLMVTLENSEVKYSAVKMSYAK